MRIWYINEIPIKAVWEADLPRHEAPIASFIDADEGVNDNLLRDLTALLGEGDINGNPKYKIVDVLGVLKIRELDGWVAHVEI